MDSNTQLIHSRFVSLQCCVGRHPEGCGSADCRTWFDCFLCRAWLDCSCSSLHILPPSCPVPQEQAARAFIKERFEARLKQLHVSTNLY